MTTSEILQFLQVEKNSTTPLKAQLEKRLEELLARLEPETLLPPERMLAESLQVSRVTVRNALQKFYEHGDIVRHGRLGTRVAPAGKRDILKDFNPLAFGSALESCPEYTLRFLLYENLPPQKEFWTKTVEIFNETSPELPIEIVWMQSGTATGRIREIIEEENIDILLDSSQFELDPEKDFHSLSPSFRELLKREDYIFSLLPVDLRYTLPVNIVSPMLFWNELLAEKMGLSNMPQLLKKEPLGKILERIAGKLPEKIVGGGRIWDYFAFTAIPEAVEKEEKLLEILEEIARIGKAAPSARKKIFTVSQKYPLENVELFNRGKSLFLPTPITMVQTMEAPSFPRRMIPFPKPEGTLLLGDFMELAITRNCMDTATAERFLSFVISPKIQRMLGEIKKTFPVEKNECMEMLERDCRYDQKKGEKFLHSLIFRSHKNDEIKLAFRFYTYFVRNELKEILEGVLSPEEGASLILSKWQKFKKRENRTDYKTTFKKGVGQ